MLRKYSVCVTAALALSLLGISHGQGQESKRSNLTGKWQLTTQNDKGKGKEDIATLDLTESGSSLLGTVTPSNGSPMPIRDGYFVGAAVKLSASGRQGLFSRSIEISGHVEKDKMILNVKKGSGPAYPSIGERMTISPQR